MSVLPQVVTRNWRLKLSAFILSVFLWAVVTVQPRNRELISSVPVQVEVLDPDWVLAEPPSPPTVTVDLGGPTRDPFDFSPSATARVVVQIDDVTSPDTIVRLRNDWVVLSGGSNVVVQSITPSTVLLRFEPTLTAAVPLSWRTINELPEGLALVQPLTLSPQVTTVRGAARIVEALDSVALQPLDLSKVTESGLYRVAVDSSGLEGLSFQPNSAQIAVNLAPKQERVLTIPVIVESPPGVAPGTLVPEPSSVQVTFEGASSLLARLNPQSVAAVVEAGSLAGIAEGNEWVVPIRIRSVPDLLTAEPATDSVRVTRMAPPGPPAPPDTLPSDTLPPDTLPRPGRRVLAERPQ